MPLKKIQLRPGVNREKTRLGDEGGWYETNLVRFRQGFPEKIGGWTRTSSNTFLGICRSLWNWVTLAGNNLLAVGTSLKFYIENGGTYYDITPIRSSVTLTNPFTTTNLSTTVTVVDASGGYKAGDFVTFYNSAAVGGLTVLGQYQIQTSTGAAYTITAASAATSSATGGGTVYAVYQLNTGSGTVSVVVGFGSGPWGGAAWGADGGPTNNGLSPISAWNQASFGQDLIFNQIGGPLYYWSAYLGFSGTALTISNASPAVVTFIGTVPQLILGQALVFTTTGVLPSPLLPGVVYYAYNISGSTCNLSTTPPATATTPVNTTTAGSGTHSTNPVGVPLTTSNGADQVPLLVNYMLVSDLNQFVICFGANDIYSTYMDPLLVRWSDQGSLTEWNPQITNQAGSQHLSRGSRIIGATQTQQQIIIWTDIAVYNMQYVGVPYVWAFQLMASDVSIMGSNCMAVAANTVFWMGVGKFYVYNGTVNTLPCDLREYVFSNMNTSQSAQFFAGTNEQFSEIWWFYCSASSSTIDSYVIYNYIDNCWYYGSLARTAWIDSMSRGYPMAATYNNNVVYHENGVDDNSAATSAAISSYATTSQFEIGDGDRFAFIRRMLPDIAFENSTAAAPAVTMSFAPLKNSGSGYTTPASVAGNSSQPVTASVVGVTSSQIDQYTGEVFVRVRGRQMSFTIACNTLGTQWRAGVQRFDVRPDGRK